MRLGLIQSFKRIQDPKLSFPRKEILSQVCIISIKSICIQVILESFLLLHLLIQLNLLYFIDVSEMGRGRVESCAMKVIVPIRCDHQENVLNEGKEAKSNYRILCYMIDLRLRNII